MSMNAFESADGSDNRTLYKMYVDKLTCDIEALREGKLVVIEARKNLLLQIAVLRLKQRKLEAEIRELRNCRAVAPPPEPKPDDAASQSITNITIPNNCSPYILLMPSSATSRNHNRMKFLVNKIFDEDINETFELVSEEPFEIVPLSKDVIMHIEHLEKIKSIILQHKQKMSNTLLKISIVQESGLSRAIKNVQPSEIYRVNTGSREIGEKFIDLTDGEDIDIEKNTKKEKSSSDIETDIESHKIYKPVVIEDNEEASTKDNKKRKRIQVRKPEDILTMSSKTTKPLSLSNVLRQNIVLYPADPLYYFIPCPTNTPNSPAINEDTSLVGTNEDVIEIS